MEEGSQKKFPFMLLTLLQITPGFTMCIMEEWLAHLASALEVASLKPKWTKVAATQPFGVLIWDSCATSLSLVKAFLTKTPCCILVAVITQISGNRSVTPTQSQSLRLMEKSLNLQACNSVLFNSIWITQLQPQHSSISLETKIALMIHSTLRLP